MSVSCRGKENILIIYWEFENDLVFQVPHVTTCSDKQSDMYTASSYFTIRNCVFCALWYVLWCCVKLFVLFFFGLSFYGKIKYQQIFGSVMNSARSSSSNIADPTVTYKQLLHFTLCTKWISTYSYLLTDASTRRFPNSQYPKIFTCNTGRLIGLDIHALALLWRTKENS